MNSNVSGASKTEAKEPQHIASVVDFIDKIASRQREVSFYIRESGECPGVDKCTNGKVKVTWSDGNEYQFACPLVSENCPVGERALKSARDTTMSALAVAGVPTIHLNRMGEPVNTEATRKAATWNFRGTLLLIGDTRTGKSFAAAQTLKRWLMRITEDESVNMFTWNTEISRFGRGVTWALAYEIYHFEELRNKATTAGILVIDDIATEDARASSQISYIINKRHDFEKPTIITTNLTIDAIKEKYGRRMYERLLEGARHSTYMLNERVVNYGFRD